MDGASQSINFANHATAFDWAQLIALFLSVLVAALAAWYAIREGRRNQARSEFTVSPAMAADRTVTHNCENIGLSIKNVGNGPAVIDDIYFLYRGVSVSIIAIEAMRWWEEYEVLIRSKYTSWHPEIVGLNLTIGKVASGELIGAGMEQNIASVHRHPMDAAKLTRYYQFTINSEVIVFYHSVHGRRFVSASAYMPEGNMGNFKTPQEWMTAHRPMPPEQPTPAK
jgi:hypothetical protein